MAHDEGGDPDDPEPVADPGEPAADRTATVEAALVIEVKAAGHRYGGRLLRRGPGAQAIQEISFTVTAGEAVGYIGPRGVGKTTMVDLITGNLSPTRGTVRTCGRSPVDDRAELSGRIGVVSGHRSRLWSDLPLAQALRILAARHRLPERRWIARRTELVERLGLASFLDLPIGQLSVGRRLRGEIAAALLHEPELVVLDEPTAGLDVRGKERLRSFLRQEHRVHRRTVFITSSDLSDVEQFCDRLLVVDQGRLAYDGDPAGLIERAGAQRVLIVDLNTTGPLLDDVPGTELLAVEAGGLRQRLGFSPGRTPTARVLADVTARAEVRDLTLQTTPIDDVVRRLAPAGQHR